MAAARPGCTRSRARRRVPATALICSLGSLFWSLVDPGGARSAPAPRIASIEITRRDVFDSELLLRDDPIYRLGNALHATTRESVVRRELLYRVGEELDTLRVVETERNLRALGILGDVTTQLAYSPDSSRVDVRLVTSDQWSTLPDPIIPEGGGGDYAAGLELEERNLLGLGKQVTAEFYTGRSVGDSYTGYGGSYQDRGLLHSRHRLNLGARFDGFTRSWSGSVDLPQRSLHDRYSYQVSGSIASGTGRRIENNEVLFRYGRKQHSLGASLTRQWHAPLPAGRHRTLSSTLGLSGSRQASFLRPDDEPYRDRVPADRTRTILEWNAVFSVKRYATARFVENFGNVEDQSLGGWVGLGATTAVDLFGNDSNRKTAEAWLSGRHRLFRPVLLSESFGVSSGSGDEGVPLAYSWRATALLTAPRRWVTALRVQGLHQRHAPSYTLNYLGGFNGLRGFGSYDLSGQSSLLCNLEERYFSPLRIYTMYLGGAAFVETGKIWSDGSAADARGFGDVAWAGDAGISLLLGLSKMPGHEVVRYDFARRITEGGFRWSIGYGMYFGY